MSKKCEHCNQPIVITEKLQYLTGPISLSEKHIRYCENCLDKTVESFTCKVCSKTVGFTGRDMNVIISYERICPDCWEQREEEKEAIRASRIGMSMAFGPGPAVFDGDW